jgi:iron(II)-dependent oxidoreductase
MRRFRILNLLLIAAAAICLALAWRTGYWTVGGAGAFAALCLLAACNPRVGGRRKTDEREIPAAQQVAQPRTRRSRVAGDTLAQQMIGQGREALLLRPQIATNLSAEDLADAQAALDEAMTIVPQGSVLLRARCYEDLDEADVARGERLVEVEGFFLDRFLVTSAEYLRFVEDGGYEQMSLWDDSIWPAVLGFTDASGQPGPRFWRDGKYLEGKAEHPVVGVSWFEAAAYARWLGKRLPTDPEWVKAGSWPVAAEGAKPIQRRFPWGDALDRGLVHLWGSGEFGTVPVTATPNSASVGGVHQLVGNVWEWTSTSFGAWEPTNRRIETPQPLKSIRGGAFDTYFEAQAHCQFQSGESPLSRKHNIGFRCALGFCDVWSMADDANPAAQGNPAADRQEAHA